MREVEFLVSYIRGYIRGRLLAHAFTRAWIERNWNSRRLRCLLSLLLATWRGGSRSSRCWRYGHLVIFSVKDTLPSSGWRKWQLARLGTFSEETSPELSLTSDFSFFIRKIGRGREGIECRLISRQECLSSRSYSLIVPLNDTRKRSKEYQRKKFNTTSENVNLFHFSINESHSRKFKR